MLKGKYIMIVVIVLLLSYFNYISYDTIFNSPLHYWNKHKFITVFIIIFLIIEIIISISFICNNWNKWWKWEFNLNRFI